MNRNSLPTLLTLALSFLVLVCGCVTRGNITNGTDPAQGSLQGMVFLTGGSFVMGSDQAKSNERPSHEVRLDPFYIDTHEVTVAQYGKFLEVTGHEKPSFWHPELDRPEDPVVGVTWDDAVAYAKWSGKRLPTEAEWEYAARGGAVGKNFPWGDNPDKGHANFSSFGIAPVKSFEPNGYGLYDVAGNVWEWCSDWFSSEYYGVSPKNNPKGPITGTHKVLRGGTWFSSAEQVRVANRYYALPDIKSFHLGFRCVKSAQ